MRTCWIAPLVGCALASGCISAKHSETSLPAWTETSHNLGYYELSGWKGLEPSSVGKLLPLGFSPDGWFAYTIGPDGEQPESTVLPRDQGVQLVNIYCDSDPCLSDAPSDPEDLCYCPIGATVKDLEKFGITPLKEWRHGRFPAQIGEEQYTIETNFVEKLFYTEAFVPGEKLEPEFPGTELFLVSNIRGRKQIDAVDHNHSAIIPHTVRASAWLFGSDPTKMIVVIGAAVGDFSGVDGASTIEFFPVVADLVGGFEVGP